MSFLVDLEGIDGSGKGTQARRLQAALIASGRTAQLLSFPRYSETLFGKGVGDFLNGRFGRLDQVDPFLVSLLYAGDRFESRGLLRDALATHDVVVLDRYVPSNIAHQASKREGAERSELIRWIERIEYEIYELPRPDLILLLDMPADQAQQLVHVKSARGYTKRAADIQEADREHLLQARATYQQVAAGNPAWRTVTCVDDGRLKSVDEIGDDIWQIMQQAFATRGG